MRAEVWTFGGVALFLLIITPIYAILTPDEPAGIVALIMAFALCAMITGYLIRVASRIDPRPEDRTDAEIVDAAGEVGFFPPRSIWPFWAALTTGLVMLAPVFGWWLMILAVALGVISVTGWVYEFYRGDHAH